MYDLEITPEERGWGFCGLRVLPLERGAAQPFETGEDELIVLPLEGGARGHASTARRSRSRGRAGVFDGPTDFVYVPRDAHVEISGDGRVALPSSRALEPPRAARASTRSRSSCAAPGR